jgi:hypothetical protein
MDICEIAKMCSEMTFLRTKVCRVHQCQLVYSQTYNIVEIVIELKCGHTYFYTYWYKPIGVENE